MAGLGAQVRNLLSSVVLIWWLTCGKTYGHVRSLPQNGNVVPVFVTGCPTTPYCCRLAAEIRVA
eukprot:11162231-Lingulodinium_polyedra.AAC.1